jgi:hypothetical protein
MPRAQAAKLERKDGQESQKGCRFGQVSSDYLRTPELPMPASHIRRLPNNPRRLPTAGNDPG